MSELPLDDTMGDSPPVELTLSSQDETVEFEAGIEVGIEAGTDIEEPGKSESTYLKAGLEESDEMETLTGSTTGTKSSRSDETVRVGNMGEIGDELDESLPEYSNDASSTNTTSSEKLYEEVSKSAATALGFATPSLKTGLMRRRSRVTFESESDFGEKDVESYYGESFVASDLLLDSYSNWSGEHLPLFKSEIRDIFHYLKVEFAFQEHSVWNQYDHFMRLLDSRSARMKPEQALLSLHLDFIGGENANFRRWYFASGLHKEEAIFFSHDLSVNVVSSYDSLDLKSYFRQLDAKWRTVLKKVSYRDYATHIALYLLCWGEANTVRFMPECLSFILKTCLDYHYASPDTNFTEESRGISLKKSDLFLDNVITPLYEFHRDQIYEFDGRNIFRKKADHSQIIGYDDINQTFWDLDGLKSIKLVDGTKLLEYPFYRRFDMLHEVDWSASCKKTYFETRTWMHSLVNFSRVWIIHLCVFWMFVAGNWPSLYTTSAEQQMNSPPPIRAVISGTALAGPLALFITICSFITEMMFVPRSSIKRRNTVMNFTLLILLFLIELFPSIYVFGTLKLEDENVVGTVLAWIQFLLALFTVIYLAIVPLQKIFANPFSVNSSVITPQEVFTSCFPDIPGSGRLVSIGLWLAVFTSKFLESYFFMILSLKNPIRELQIMKVKKCAGDRILGTFFCQSQPKVILILIVFTDLILFFLDTYLWYVLWSTLFSLFRAFYLGLSIWTPWRNVFIGLPRRMYSKLLFLNDDNSVRPEVPVSKLWNTIINNLYRDHFISAEKVDKLYYKSVSTNPGEGQSDLREPTVFVSLEDQSSKYDLFDYQSESERRISFFAQSLSTSIPEPYPLTQLPSFTVLISHYSEKIMLTLKEIIKENEYSRTILLDYLKNMHPTEWRNFVRDTKSFMKEREKGDFGYEDELTSEFDSDLPLYSIGFKTTDPEFMLRTRIWASLRSQTLYRTVSGFMNYSRALKDLYEIENPDKDRRGISKNISQSSAYAERKVRLVVSMQRLFHFSDEEYADVESLLRVYPEVHIAYIVEEHSANNHIEYYSALINGYCGIENNRRKPLLKIRLSGNPILGDGKSDNQNHAIIFHRGEYIQLIDSNQDHYFEECLKIRNVLAEFEEMKSDLSYYESDTTTTSIPNNPVAIVGTREYIFSEHIGVLGDVAAGKEQTFGTLFARTLGQVGAKLHYGHPDFLNGIFMTTRGGVSKAQRGLHLNEDIYAGITAFARGGRIKHCEYMQCGKGRDMGFGSILNFTTKIGAGMGEQTLSREYYYLGSQLPLDRVLSFFYAHPGFHFNNVFICFAFELLCLVVINMVSFVQESVICEYDKHKPINTIHKPVGCYNLIPVVEWLKRCILSIFLVFLVSFLPLTVQELMERGMWRAVNRFFRHFLSLSPLFEIFSCRIYGKSLIDDIAVGGAKYISTGRGFATSRIPFTTLYSRFSHESLYFGCKCLLLMLFSSILMWQITFLWLWITVFSLVCSPFIFNPNQFSLFEFILDYKGLVQWFSTGNKEKTSETKSWIDFVKSSRLRVTGVKELENDRSLTSNKDVFAPNRFNLLFTNLLTHLCATISILTAFFMVNAQNDVSSLNASNSFLRLLICSFGPLICNGAFLISQECITCFLGPGVGHWLKKFPLINAALAKTFSLLNYSLWMELLWFLQGWRLFHLLIGLTSVIMIQSLVFRFITCFLLGGELRSGKLNNAWWSGKWYSVGIGFSLVTQFVREFLCKLMEMSQFVCDFFLCHLILFIQIPLLMIPYIDRGHSLMLLWLKPSQQLVTPLYSDKVRRQRRRNFQKYFVLFLLMLLFCISLVVVPIVLSRKFLIEVDIDELLPDWLGGLLQPASIGMSRKGLKKKLYINNT